MLDGIRRGVKEEEVEELFVPVTYGFTHRTLRPHLADLLGVDRGTYTTNQMSYDLRRLRLKGIIWRVPHSHRYVLTPYGRKVALFFTRLHARVFRPGFATLDPADPILGPAALDPDACPPGRPDVASDASPPVRLDPEAHPSTR